MQKKKTAKQCSTWHSSKHYHDKRPSPPPEGFILPSHLLAGSFPKRGNDVCTPPRLSPLNQAIYDMYDDVGRLLVTLRPVD